MDATHEADLTLYRLAVVFGPYLASGILAALLWFVRREFRRLDSKFETLDDISDTVISMKTDFKGFETRMVQSEQDRVRIWQKMEELLRIQVQVAALVEAIDWIKKHPSIAPNGPHVDVSRHMHAHYETPKDIPQPKAPPTNEVLGTE